MVGVRKGSQGCELNEGQGECDRHNQIDDDQRKVDGIRNRNSKET